MLNKGKPEAKHLTGEQAEAKLTLDVDGLTIKPVYADNAPHRHAGLPGSMPFTRGRTLDRGEGHAWHVAALHDDPTTCEKRIAADLSGGATSIWFRVDNGGIPAASLGDALGAVDTTSTPVVFSSVSEQRSVLDAVKPHFASAVECHVGLDPYAAALASGSDVDVELVVEAINAAGNADTVFAVTLDQSAAHLAGATCTDQVAFAAAAGIDLLRKLDAAGIPAETAWPHITFRFSVDQDQFQNIAMLRAARQVWARVGEVLGIDENVRGARLHAVTSPRMMSTVDPYNNLLRTTLATFSAGVGGAQIVTTLPFDHPIGLPNDFSRRMARNTQSLLLAESHVGQVIDPAGGSTYVESITAEMAEDAWSSVQAIEKDGGYGTFVTTGKLADRCTAGADARAAKIANRSLPLTGVTEFAPLHDAQVDAAPREDTATGLTPRRDTAVVESLRDRGRALATGDTPYSVPVVTLGAYKQYAARLSFVKNILAIGELDAHVIEHTPGEPLPPLGDAPVVILAASPAHNTEHGSDLVDAVRAAGATRVTGAGRATEWPASTPDDYVGLGCDALGFVASILDTAK